ncbi:hypothetical protein I5G62_gp95 [Mycobacterium phage CRB2]|uniref:Uncharacterized protein n=1 Tax=Mycobacterium phage CRB2 TaxID=2483623 RepID=A0A455M8J7_9CAUD|nr:hypothetical protein I5G62_gp95 [Mycobacterium phage CRB2]AYP70081.1 hypothetical protein CRB2_95 [Mycobacterium phage CRB2]
MSAAHPYIVVIQDEGQFDHVEYVREASLEGAMIAVTDLAAAMEGTQVGSAMDEAPASLDIDGKIEVAVWYTLPGSELRSLVAIVNETPVAA